MQVTESDAVDVVEVALQRHSSDITTRAMSLVALLKLSSRFPPTSEYALNSFNYIKLLWCFLLATLSQV